MSTAFCADSTAFTSGALPAAAGGIAVPGRAACSIGVPRGIKNSMAADTARITAAAAASHAT